MKKLAVVLLVSLSTTVLFAQSKGKDKKDKASPAEVVDKKVAKMKKDLSLNDEQTEKIKIAMQARTEAFVTNKKVIKEAEANIKTATKTFNDELEKTLTADQLAKHKEMVKNRKDKDEDSE